MIVSVGQLYSSTRLLDLVSISPLSPAEIRDAEATVLVAPMTDVLNLCTRCGWLELDGDGLLRNSSRGEWLRTTSSYQDCLRHQLRDVIVSLQPAWSKKLLHGRCEFSRYAPADVVQCFADAGLLVASITETVVDWWDELAQLARGLRSAALSAVGRKAERLTLAYELERTGSEPFWQSLESSFSGYDVLSISSQEDQTPLQIEVKASELRIKEAWFHLTSHEWECAQQARAHRFHLWQLGKQQQLAIIRLEDIEHHICSNRGEGQWETLKVPFHSFSKFFNYVPL